MMLPRLWEAPFSDLSNFTSWPRQDGLVAPAVMSSWSWPWSLCPADANLHVKVELGAAYEVKHFSAIASWSAYRKHLARGPLGPAKRLTDMDKQARRGERLRSRRAATPRERLLFHLEARMDRVIDAWLSQK